MLLDQLVRMYPAYKHDDIFHLSTSEVYTIKLMHLEQNYHHKFNYLEKLEIIPYYLQCQVQHL